MKAIETPDDPETLDRLDWERGLTQDDFAAMLVDPGLYADEIATSDELDAEQARADKAAWAAAHRAAAVELVADEIRVRNAARELVAAEMAGPAGGDWAPVDLAEFLDAEPITAEVGLRSDGVALFYAGCVNLVFGESASGKSWVALLAARDVLAAGGSVVYLDAEDGPQAIAQRLKVLGVEAEALARFTYVRPASWSLPGRDALASAVAKASLVVVDATTEFLSLLGLSANLDTDVARFMEVLPKWAARLGPAVVVIDHTPKDSTNRNGPQGSQHKRAAVDGAAYYVEPIYTLKPSGEGWSKVYVSKDKQGGVIGHAVRTRGGELFADLRVDGGFRLDPPITTPEIAETPEEREAAKVDALKIKVTTALAGWTGDRPPGSRNAVLHFLREQRVEFKNADLTKALLDSLVSSGNLTPGYGFATAYTTTDEIEDDDGDAY